MWTCGGGRSKACAAVTPGTSAVTLIISRDSRRDESAQYCICAQSLINI